MGAFIILAAVAAAYLFFQLSILYAVALAAGLLAFAVLMPGEGLRFMAAVIVLIVVGYILAIASPPATVATELAPGAKPSSPDERRPVETPQRSKPPPPSVTTRRARPRIACPPGECWPAARPRRWRRDDWDWDDCPPFRIPRPPRWFDRI
jgi:hypothetical protein